MPKWTKEQQQAIDLEGKNIIVSAGAGSGKTAVLSERVIRKLENNVNINELLILTFTNAAAQEMKERIRNKIEKNKDLEEQLDLIDSSYITTFDSFSLSIVKKYHTRLNISNKIKITDDVIIELKKREILDEIFDEKYLLKDRRFLKLINNFCLKDDKELKKYILNIIKKIELKYDKEEYLNNYINNYFNENNITNLLNEYLKELKKYTNEIKKIIIKLNDYYDGDFIAKLEDNYKKLINANTYEEVLEGLNNITVIKSPKGSSEEAKALKGKITKIKDELKKLCICETTDEIINDIYETKNNQEELIDIIKKLNNKLTKYKYENEFFNFNDIAHMAIKVVSENEDIREELKNKFNEIMVDEYQDTSDTQEKFISMISNNNVYMVGDIKQSIYRFRNSNPYIFKNKYDKYSNEEDGIKIDLNKNFRSRKEVLDNINDLFEKFMDDEIGGANYKKSHKMIFGNNAYLEEGKTPQDNNINFITYKIDKKSNISKEEREIFLIGNDIKNKIENKYQIFDKDTNKLRNIKYSDFVILIDKSKSFNLYKKIFEYLHIPLSIMKDEALRKDDDILVIKNLIKLIICIKNNTYTEEFKYSFLSVSRSFLYKTEDEIIFDIFRKNNFKETTLFNKCLELSKIIDNTTPSEFFYNLIEEFEYDKKLIEIANVKANRTRCEYFYNLIKDFEEAGNTIYDFIDYLDNIFECDFDLKFSINNNESDSAKIMTIHKSKGLEFPICYYAGFTNEFNLTELKEKIIFDNKYGIVIPKVDNYYKNTICKTLLKINTKKEEISEKIRLLYVALTRAKEKMIVVIPEIEEEKEQNDIVEISERLNYKSFLSIIKSIYSNILEYVKEGNNDLYTKEYIDETDDREKINSLKLSKDEIKVKEINIENEIIEEKKYSKSDIHLIEKDEYEVLSSGTKIHQLLEQIDFKNPNYDNLDINEELKDKIKKFITSDLISKNINNKFYKEYEFIYEEDNIKSHGIIDLMIEGTNEIIIIDYKLKNIYDINYNNQLNGYKNVISKKTNKKILCYLYSILDSKFKEV